MNSLLVGNPTNNEEINPVEPLYNEDLYIYQLTVFFSPVTVKYKRRYSEQILPVPWPFVILSFHCSLPFTFIRALVCTRMLQTLYLYYLIKRLQMVRLIQVKKSSQLCQ